MAVERCLLSRKSASHPPKTVTFFIKFGFAAGNGLTGVTAFSLSPWAANMEDDVKDINGRNRDYLLQAAGTNANSLWASRMHSLGVTGGIIDATEYLDENEYSNDEYTQFMNKALSMRPTPFYGPMILVVLWNWDTAQCLDSKVCLWTLGKNDDGNNFNFYGVQFNYTLQTPRWGKATIGVSYNWSSEAFLDPEGSLKERCGCLIFSFDQALGGTFSAPGSDLASRNQKH